MKTRERKRAQTWGVLAQSVRGAAHCRKGEPNQDAVAWFPVDVSGPPLILAVSDGHGSSKSFRSDRGARFAVSAAVEEAQKFLAGLPESIEAAREAAEKDLPQALVQAWVRLVLNDIAEEPFAAKERKAFVAQYGAPAWKALKANPLLAYGATLLLAVATQDFLVLAQIGDGDIVTVTRAGCASRPLRLDPRLFAGETTSLCTADAVESFCVFIGSMKEDRPALVLLSSDGYANSYEDDGGFLSVGSDLLMMLREHDAETVQRDLEPWLEEVSREGSGDDITLGVLCLL
jgi:serine/threonine protein phosphatase PrpC